VSLLHTPASGEGFNFTVTTPDPQVINEETRQVERASLNGDKIRPLWSDPTAWKTHGFGHVYGIRRRASVHFWRGCAQLADVLREKRNARTWSTPENKNKVYCVASK